MTFLHNVESLPAQLVHHTGTMIRFTTGQLPDLPTDDLDCEIALPDGGIVAGHFRRHPANPYVGGRALVQWIKSWLPYGSTATATVYQVHTANRIRVALSPPDSGTTSDNHRRRVGNRARKLRKISSRERRRRSYETWERDPALRGIALAAWGTNCQVEGCMYLSDVPDHIRGRMVDVHHLNHVGAGGSDSPMNISVLCVVHHQLIHRAPGSSVRSWDLDQATVLVNGLTLSIARDARRIL